MKIQEVINRIKKWETYFYSLDRDAEEKKDYKAFRAAIKYLKSIEDVQPVSETENMATASDEFICKKCGIYIKDYRC